MDKENIFLEKTTSKKSIKDKIKNIIQGKIDDRYKNKTILNLQEVMADAYEMANLEDGFDVKFFDLDSMYDGEVELYDYVTKTISKSNYKLAMHEVIWEYLALDEKFAILILMEEELAKISGRPEAIFRVADFGKDGINNYEAVQEDGEIYYDYDWRLLQNIATYESSFEVELDKTEVLADFEDWSYNKFILNGEEDIVDVSKDIKIIDQYENALCSAYDIAQTVLWLTVEAEALLATEEFEITGKCENAKKQALIDNSFNYLDEWDLQDKFLNKEKLTILEKIRLCGFVSQAIYQEFLKGHEFLEEISVYNQSDSIGLGYKDLSWESFEERVFDNYMFVKDLKDEIYPEKKNIEIYNEALKAIRSSNNYKDESIYSVVNDFDNKSNSNLNIIEENEV